ncbi:DUF1428 domain-containing protein [Novosphingobium sp. 1949]|uniref:DUF1428 domain-containing protein n=1 Tax=Novosphingobium organovorum TaxID=2930092 RepID=A0ABT0B985_9SPHN|nr:DUF1428 domain-containing protein [Novosphingobium organovorum]MCJ2181494.1 DUF1428 domain-containing protein [Novosphingobium organovorum]
MYVQGFLVPVPSDSKEAYRTVAEKFWAIARDYGCQRQVETWEADVKDGQYTDFRKAVDLQPGEKVVFSWMIWPDRATADEARTGMMADPRMKTEFGPPDGSAMPFDGKRMVIGGFDLLFDTQA